MPTTVTILAILIVTLCPCQGECPIECYCDETTICSGDKILTRLPQLTNWNAEQILITRLELHDFLIEHLDKTHLLGFISNLTEFHLTSNPRLSSIDNDTFGGSVIAGGGGRDGDNSSQHDDLGQVDSLTTLLPLNLRTLDLSGNSLKYFVAGEKLKRLRVLDLSSNRLQQVYLLEHLHSLESVNLRDNLIHFLEATLFQNLRNLQYINLDSNKIGRLDPTTFSNLPSLAHLILSSNPIENLLPGFVWNSRVQFVDVSHVGLTHIPTSLTTSVRDFRCASNNLTIIRQSDFESYPNVGLLVLDENSIETVEDDAFGRLDFLARLWINGNRLSRIPQNLPPSLRSLQLEDNRINSVSAVDFKSLRSLEELNLHGNQIVAIPASTFSDLNNLRNLDLRSNQLDTIERDSFKNLTRLETLDISQNPIKVIVNGVFHDLQKLSLLHLSRLREKNIDFDPGSFHSLVNLQILELDDSPFLTKTILRESALGYFMSLIELNLQRCDLEDLHLVSSSLLDSPLFDSVRVVKLSGNPWDCSETENENFKEFLQLYRKKVIVDAEQMICADPKGIKVMSVAINSTLNETNVGRKINPIPPKTSTVNALDTVMTPVTPNVSAYSVTSPPKLINDIMLSSSSTTKIVQPVPIRIITPRSLTFSTVPKGEITRTTSTPNYHHDDDDSYHHNNATSPSPPKAQAPAASSVGLGITITEKPTRSYFADQTTRPTTRRRTTTRGTLPISNKDDESRQQLFSVSDTPDQDENMEQQQHGASRTNKKTNDDNAIIDEERNPTSFHQRQHYSEPTQRFRGSIDGFPAFPDDDPVAKESSHTSSSSKNSRQPNPSYLKSSQQGVRYENQSVPKSANSAVILKTLIISAVACLLSILFLLLLSLAVYRFSTWKPKRGPISIGRRKWDKRGEDCDNALYQSFNPHNRGPTGVYTRLGDQDTVELSGITNRLYFENEDIYHIT